ncbi:hypothetical protein DFA_07521 [Cavenderia fasciculata]|uniref:Integrase catalytic domain-containing protein n=1 Tax=Cavenderia fasciculata TaxID=261658 RepID=F4PWN3_CACFS|nr:uncharacterized protein DFA_07521 [Cavenderia fasciculata]EGG20397.1 hypothetical protein DFA_07521 [Cavenderia fasciculata]|eukprot:XP_004367380.1 hypothetical protein DFA_07521 [Cavenderia fasciculata]
MNLCLIKDGQEISIGEDDALLSDFGSTTDFIIKILNHKSTTTDIGEKSHVPINTNHRRHRCQMDVMEFETSLAKYKYLVSIINCYTKYRWMVPIKKNDAQSIVNAYDSIEDIRNEPFEILQTGKGKELNYELIETYCKKVGTKKINSSIGQPHWNGGIVKSTRDALSKYVDMTNWETHIPHIQESLNNQMHNTIKMEPKTCEKFIDPDGSKIKLHCLYSI